MASVKIYRPKSLTIPKSSLVRRDYRKHSNLSPDSKKNIDIDTLFYDVFFEKPTNSIIGIGPDLEILRANLFPMKISVNGHNLRFRFQQIKGIAFVTTESLDEKYSNLLEVVFDFNKFSCKVELDLKVSDQFSQKDKRHRLTITTLQKNNPEVWIQDWLTWHNQAYGVTRAVIYDNGSDALNGLLNCLKNLRIEMDIIVVLWPYPYGIEPDNFCQRGSLNHCRLRYAVNFGYCINLDIDEYLMSFKKNILNFLDCNISFPAPGTVHLQPVMIPNVHQKPSQIQVRSYDFYCRSQKITGKWRVKKWKTYGRGKYIYSYENVGYNSVHHTESILNREFCERFSIHMKAIYYLKKVAWECTRFLHRGVIPKPRIDTIYPHKSDFCFLHFRGLNTGWKTDGVTTQVEGFDPSKHEVEPRIRQIHMMLSRNDSLD